MHTPALTFESTKSTVFQMLSDATATGTIDSAVCLVWLLIEGGIYFVEKSVDNNDG